MGIENLGKMARLLTLTLALLLCSAFFLAPIRAEEEDDASLEDVGVDDDVEKEAKEEMDRMDADKNGKVSLEEISTYFRTEFYSDEDMADSTEGADGKPPTPEEIAELVKNDASEFLTELDKDKDGSLTLEELKEQYMTDPDDLEDDDAGGMEERMRITITVRKVKRPQRLTRNKRCCNVPKQ